MAKRKRLRRGEKRKAGKGEAYRKYKRLKAKWGRHEELSGNVDYLLKVERAAERIHRKHKRAGLTKFYSQYLAELHTSVFDKKLAPFSDRKLKNFWRTAKTSFERHGWGTVEGLAKEFIDWINRPAFNLDLKDGRSFTLVEHGFADHLSQKMGPRLARKAEEFRLFQERRERPTLTRQTYLDSRTDLFRFAVYSHAEAEMKGKEKVSPLWGPSAVNYFLERLKDCLQNEPEERRPKTVKALRALIKAVTQPKIDTLLDEAKELPADKAAEVLGQRKMFKAYQGYLVQLAGERYKRLGLKG